jgi:hypothetical protein
VGLTQHQITGGRQQETNQERQEPPGAHPLVGGTPEGEQGPLVSPLVGGGAGKVPCCTQCSYCVQWVATAHAEVNAGVEERRYVHAS